jgi:hypothetical protein
MLILSKIYAVKTKHPRDQFVVYSLWFVVEH